VSTAIALFTRDLRVHDNPMLTAAVNAADHVVPLFVHDDALVSSNERTTSFNQPRPGMR
jgi:deoxyribodipyrimidine photo-lyase